MLDVAHGLLGLGTRVAEADQVAVEIAADLAAHIHGVAGAHGLAQVIVQALVGVGLFSVEHADARVGRHQKTPGKMIRR
ncbi:hypothetical protein HXW90_12970 [Pseudomonas sp. Y39-6]|nr:hypothetical protein [Pseudomonas sp. Y39-6]QPO17976.1 hypothetical protein HXW90_12970 [Pseudomonas sp. Y39-6]